MTGLYLLGRLGLFDATGAPATELCARPKTVALLVYLALARPRGYQAQDALLAMFWPESDTARAKLSLRQSLHLLRRFLGEGIVSRRGRAEIGVVTDTVRCDVLDFDQAIEAGALDRALAAYDGELLPGFYIPDAPEFERWLNAERSRLRETAIETARTLALRFRDSGDARASAYCARRWSDIAIGDVDALHHTIVALTDIGDHSAALRTYDDFVGSRSSDDAIVNAETERLVATTRAVLAQNVANIQVASSSPLAPAPLPARSMSVSRRWVAATTIAASLLVALAYVIRLGPSAWAARTTSAEDRATAMRIAVMPFAVHGGAQVGYLRDGIVDLLSAKLDGTSGLSTVDPQLILAQEGVAGIAAITQDRARQLASQLAAGLFVMGSIVDVGGRIEFTVSLYARDGSKRISIDAVAADEALVLPAIDKIARELVGAQFIGAPARMEHVAATTTTSLPALKSFLDGERALRAGQLTAAEDAFKRAVALDSTFALAHYRLSTTALWSTDSVLIRAAIAASERFAERLPQHERLVLAARSAVVDGAADDAERSYRSIVVTYPDDADAWNQLGELRFHAGPWRGLPLVESRAAFEQVVRLHPADINALLHLVRVAAMEQRRADVDSLANVALALNPERGTSLELRALRAVALSNLDAQRQLLDTFRLSTGLGEADNDLLRIVGRVAMYTDDPRFGTAMVAAVADSRDVARLPMSAHVTLAHLAVTGGQWNRASQELNTVEHADAGLAAEVRANFAVTRPAMLTADARARLRRTLDAPSPIVAGDSIRLVRRAYLSGTLALSDGDERAVRRQVSVLANRGATRGADSELARHLAHELEARRLWRHGEVSAALRKVEAGWPHGGPSAALPLFQGETLTEGHERVLRGALLVALGRDAEAAPWFRAVSEDQAASFFLSADVHIVLAQIAERRGDPTGARSEYQSAVDLWRNADPELRGTLDSTRSSVLRLGRKSAPRPKGSDPAGK